MVGYIGEELLDTRENAPHFGFDAGNGISTGQIRPSADLQSGQGRQRTCLGGIHCFGERVWFHCGRDNWGGSTGTWEKAASIEDLHVQHQGIERTKRPSRQILFWPRLNQEFNNMVRNCSECRILSPSEVKDPLIQTPRPSLPFAEVTCDLFSCTGSRGKEEIEKMAAQCERCVRNLPSLPREPVIMAKPPNSPFEDVAVDLFYFHGPCYLLYMRTDCPIGLKSTNSPMTLVH
eukprot:maker-scaffold49_size462716-snap-gene-3.33 protein:Tk03626 transcript:maker-scaffold49_size462716-snap-gene-3.33-mRNA-1 annotation:"PREDICTED: uncharacterized protein K02A2.6-like"